MTVKTVEDLERLAEGSVIKGPAAWNVAVKVEAAGQRMWMTAGDPVINPSRRYEYWLPNITVLWEPTAEGGADE